MDLICNNRRNYALTIGRTYTDAEVVPGRERYVRLRNDNGVLATYHRDLFTELRATPVPPPPPPAPVIRLHNLNTLLDQPIFTYNATDRRISLSLEIAEGIVFRSEETLNLSPSIIASCGIGCITNISSFVDELIEELREAIQRHLPRGMTIEQHYGVSYNILLSNILEAMFRNFILSNNTFAFYIISNNTNESDFVEIFSEAMSEIAMSTEEAENPNSGNNIIMWTIGRSLLS